MSRITNKTLYLQGRDEELKLAEGRENKIVRLAKKGKTTQAGAIRMMIDAYKE